MKRLTILPCLALTALALLAVGSVSVATPSAPKSVHKTDAKLYSSHRDTVCNNHTLVGAPNADVCVQTDIKLDADNVGWTDYQVKIYGANAGSSTGCSSVSSIDSHNLVLSAMKADGSLVTIKDIAAGTLSPGTGGPCSYTYSFNSDGGSIHFNYAGWNLRYDYTVHTDGQGARTDYVREWQNDWTWNLRCAPLDRIDTCNDNIL